jgi:hypothetical protein
VAPVRLQHKPNASARRIRAESSVCQQNRRTRCGCRWLRRAGGVRAACAGTRSALAFRSWQVHDPRG